jgi:hypothetical protein
MLIYEKKSKFICVEMSVFGNGSRLDRQGSKKEVKIFQIGAEYACRFIYDVVHERFDESPVRSSGGF